MGEWRAVARNNNIPQGAKSAGAGLENIRFIRPGIEMLPSANDDEALLPVATGAKYTFRVNLNNFEWPADLRGEIYVVVTQALGRDGSKDTWQGVLQSRQLFVKAVSQTAGRSRQQEPAPQVPD